MESVDVKKFILGINIIKTVEFFLNSSYIVYK